MPSAAVLRVVGDVMGEVGAKPHPYLSPSMINTEMGCRRQEVWKRFLPYGINPLEEWGKHAGTAMHLYLGTAEIETPRANYGTVCVEDGKRRIEVLGLLLRGRMDNRTDDGIIEDLKTTKPFIGFRGELIDWEDAGKGRKDSEGYQEQLSFYDLIEQQCGMAPAKGLRVWRMYQGCPDAAKTWRKFDLTPLSEHQLEARVGEWARSLQTLLRRAYDGDIEGAAKDAPADGRNMQSKKKGLWKCSGCFWREKCSKLDDWSTF